MHRFVKRLAALLTKSEKLWLRRVAVAPVAQPREQLNQRWTSEWCHLKGSVFGYYLPKRPYAANIPRYVVLFSPTIHPIYYYCSCVIFSCLFLLLFPPFFFRIFIFPTGKKLVLHKQGFITIVHIHPKKKKIQKRIHTEFK